MLRPLVFLMILAHAALAHAHEPLRDLGPVTIVGEVFEDKDISAIARLGSRFVLGADEGGRVQVLQAVQGRLQVTGEIRLADDKPEADIEGIAADGNTVYVLGSHSRVRRTAKAGNSYEENLERIRDVDVEKSRRVLFRFQLDAEGHAASIERTNLLPVIEDEKALARFTDIPGKENGVDLEGIAARDGWLYIGFRGPVLRDNLVPVLKCRFADPVTDAEFLFLDLAGHGIRDLAAVDGGFLVVAGPVGDRVEPFPLYFWDGRNMLATQPDANQRAKQVRPLAVIEPPAGGKLEGIAVLNETAFDYEIIAVFDGPPNGGARRYRVLKPTQP